MGSTDRIGKLLAPKGHCRWCKQPVPKGRRSWCSDACVKKAALILSPSTARWQVEQRDRGVCAKCNLDTEQVRRVLSRIYARAGGFYDRPRDETYRDAWAWFCALVSGRSPFFPGSVPTLWEADHIVPVIEGGGECGLENYRTLCTPCHREETAGLRRRMAERRSKQPTLLQNNMETV